MTIALNTEEFWEVMCSMAFIRLDLYSGVCRGARFITLSPPETVPGFVSTKIINASLLLGTEQSQITRV
jgi:hypothetical protein